MAKPAASKALRKLVASIPGAKPAPYPGLIEYCHPTLRPKLPTGARWQYEIKFDGYRVLLHRNEWKSRAFSRSGLGLDDQLRYWYLFCCSGNQRRAAPFKLCMRNDSLNKAMLAAAAIAAFVFIFSLVLVPPATVVALLR